MAKNFYKMTVDELEDYRNELQAKIAALEAEFIEAGKIKQAKMVAAENDPEVVKAKIAELQVTLKTIRQAEGAEE